MVWINQPKNIKRVDNIWSQIDDAIYNTNDGRVNIYDLAVPATGMIFDSVLPNQPADDDVQVTLPESSGTIALETTATGSFVSNDGKTVTVVKGIITSIE